MRLSIKEINIIKTKVENIFGEAVIYLFGSGLYDSKKAEISIYILFQNLILIYFKKR